MMSFFNSLFFVGSSMVVICLLSFCLQRKHLLNALLILEMLILSIFLVLISLVSSSSNEGMMVFVLLTLAACEASLGLSMLVVLIRAHGNDYVKSLSIHKC